MFSHLTGWRVNIGLLQEASSKELFTILEKCEGTKVRLIINHLCIVVLSNVFNNNNIYDISFVVIY